MIPQAAPTIAPYYDCDGITIHLGDCRDVLPTLGQFDLLLTDPPYGIDAGNMTLGKGQSDKPHSQRFAKHDWDKKRPSVSQWMNIADSICIWGGNYFTDELPPTNHWLVWHKQNDGRSFSECEFAWTNFGKQSRHFSWGWLHGSENKFHPTQKPIALMRWCIRLAFDPVVYELRSDAPENVKDELNKLGFYGGSDGKNVQTLFSEIPNN